MKHNYFYLALGGHKVVMVRTASVKYKISLCCRKVEINKPHQTNTTKSKLIFQMKPQICQGLVLGNTEAEDTGILHLTSVNWNLHVALLSVCKTNQPGICLITPGDHQQDL